MTQFGADLVIRLAVNSEQRQLEALQWRASLANENDREALLAHQDAIELPLEQIANGDVFVFEIEGVIAGFAAIRSGANQEIEIDGLFVEPLKQRQGAGRLLVGYCARAAVERKCGAMSVVATPHACAFYVSCGFTQIGFCQTRFGLAPLMRRLL